MKLEAAAGVRYFGDGADRSHAHRRQHPPVQAGPVPADVVYACWTMPVRASGNNRQGWRVIVVRDPAVRVQLRDLYRRSWYSYHAPLFTPPGQPPTPDHYADHLDEVPVQLVVLVK
jgi:nitroreductase